MSACKISINHLCNLYLSFTYTLPLCVEMDGGELNVSMSAHMCVRVCGGQKAVVKSNSSQQIKIAALL